MKSAGGKSLSLDGGSSLSSNGTYDVFLSFRGLRAASMLFLSFGRLRDASMSFVVSEFQDAMR